MANYNELLFGLGGYLDAMQPRYAVGRIPEAPSAFAQTTQGMMGGRKLDQQQQLREIVKQKGWAGLMDDPEATGLMAEMDPQGFMRGLVAQQVAREKAKLAANGTSPIQNYEYRKKLVEQHGEGSPEVRQLDSYVRANPWINLGGSMALPNVQNPSQPTASIPKTLAPEDVPANAAAKAGAVKSAQGSAEIQTGAEKKVVQSESAVSLLEGVEDTIRKSTGSGIGAGVDYGASIFGYAPEGAKAAGQLKVLQNNLMLSMPRFEGPQSDKDTNMYREAAGQIGDPSVPNEIKLAAVETIRTLAKKYKSFGSKTPGLPVGRGGQTSGGLNWSIER